MGVDVCPHPRVGGAGRGDLPDEVDFELDLACDGNGAYLEGERLVEGEEVALAVAGEGSVGFGVDHELEGGPEADTEVCLLELRPGAVPVEPVDVHAKVEAGI